MSLIQYCWRPGDAGYLYGVVEPVVVQRARHGYATVCGVRVAQRHLQRHVVVPRTYRDSRPHSHYLRLSGLEQGKPTPWRVLEVRPDVHLAAWLDYKKHFTRTTFLRFIRKVCPRVHVDDNLRILCKDQPKRTIGDVVYLHGYRDLESVVRGYGNTGWYLVSNALGVVTCHRSTLWCRGYSRGV